MQWYSSDALRYIHNKKILNNDIKSDNIVMVKEENKEIIYSPILVDFGKAKSDVYSIGVVFYRVNKLIKDKDLKEICTKCLVANLKKKILQTKLEQENGRRGTQKGTNPRNTLQPCR